MLNIKARVGDILAIGDIATIRIAEKAGQYVALIIQADRSVPIRRLDVENLTFVEERHAEVPDPLDYGPADSYFLGLFRQRPAAR